MKHEALPHGAALDRGVTHDEDDHAQARRIVAGDRRAFERLMRRYNRRLYRLARATLRDDTEAEDALQDAYVAAFRSIAQFRGDAALGTWLSRLVLNECFARLRRSARRENVIPMVAVPSHMDIDAGKLAESKGQSNAVKDFGKMMVTDHTGVNKQASDLVKKLGVKPEENDTSRSLKKGGDENLANLKKLSGAAFDKAYIDHEVAYHQQVLDAVDKTLIPSAKNAELKGLIEKVRPAFVAHLEHAKNIQSSFAGKS